MKLNVDQLVLSSHRKSSSEVKRDHGSYWWSEELRSSNTRYIENGAGKVIDWDTTRENPINQGHGSGVGFGVVGLGAISSDNVDRG